MHKIFFQSEFSSTGLIPNMQITFIDWKSFFESVYFPPPRLDSEVYDEDGNSLPSLDYDRNQMDVRSPPSVADDFYSLYYPPEKR